MIEFILLALAAATLLVWLAYTEKQFSDDLENDHPLAPEAESSPHARTTMMLRDQTFEI